MGKWGKQWQTLFWGGSKITEDGDCSHESKRHLLLGRKAMTNLGSILKSRDITLPTKVHLVKSVIFPVVMYGCESWTVKKAEHWRIDAFELWCWRRLESSLDSKEIQPVHPKGNKFWIFIARMMLKLKLQYFGHLMNRIIGKDPILLGKIEDGRRRGQQMMRWLDGITNTMDMSLRSSWELVMNREDWHAEVLVVTKSQTSLKDWSELKLIH